MLKKRVIAVIIVRDGGVVQSVRFKHTNVIHYDAYHAVETFNRWAVDEIVLLNVSPSEKSQKQFLEVLVHVSSTCFVPLSVGGWINSEKYGTALIENGADKLVLNSAFYNNPGLVKRLSNKFGVQCIVGSLDVKRNHAGDARIGVDRGEVLIDTPPGEWAVSMVAMGAGEILFNSIEYDGNRKGYDLKFLEEVCQAVRVPVIAFGGVFFWKHLVQGFEAGADAVAAANIFHYKEHATKQAKRYLADKGYPVRREGQVSYEIL